MRNTRNTIVLKGIAVINKNDNDILEKVNYEVRCKKGESVYTDVPSEIVKMSTDFLHQSFNDAMQCQCFSIFLKT